MTSELRVDNLKGSTTGGSINVLGEGTSATTNLQQGLCKVWAEFGGTSDGNSTITLNDSFNVTSLTDNGTGDYTFAYTNNMASINYVFVGSGQYETGAVGSLISLNTKSGDANNRGTSSVRTACKYMTPTGGPTDYDYAQQQFAEHGDFSIMASEIKVDTIVNAGGDNDTGIDLATNDQILLKVANATKLTMNSTGQTTIVGEGGSTTTNLQQGLAKGFVCVDVSAGAAFSSNDSFNIASVNDSGTGHMALTFTNNMATVRYNAPGGCYTATGHTVGVTAEATTGTNMRISDNGGSASDTDSYMAFIGTMA